MSKKNTNIASQALSEMEEIKASLTEGSKSIISSLLNEAVKDYMRDSINDDDDNDEDEDYEVIDAENNEKDNDETEVEQPEEVGNTDEADDTETEEVPEEGEADNEDPDEEEDGDEWSEFDDYKVGDNEYDLTGVKDDETVVKVYKLLKDTDNVVVKKDGDKVTIQDHDNDAEYVLDLGEDETPDKEEEKSIDGENSGEMEDSPKEKKFENKKSRKTMKESKEVIFEVDLGYTDDYQKKDVIQGLNNNEPSDKETLDKGIPTDAKKNFAGNAKAESDPFGKTVKEEGKCEACKDKEVVEEKEDELDEAAMSNSTQDVRKMTKSNKSSVRKEHLPQVSKEVSVAGTKLESIDRKFKKALKENKELKEAVVKIKGALQEALIVNVNLGQFVKLVTENTTTQAEKIDILNRLNEAKTIEQSKSLYENIKRDLNKEVSSQAKINEGSMKINESKSNETEIFQSPEMLKMIDLNKKLNLL